MTKPKISEHMSMLKIKGDKLPPLQRLIILHLAKSEPQTINETVKALSKSYKPTWSAFNSLQGKKLIGKVDVKEYRGRKYPLFWLTDEGIITAILEGAERSVLLEKGKMVFSDAKVHCFLEVVEHMNPAVLYLARKVVKDKEELDFVDIMSLLVSDAMFETDVETMKKTFAGLKKYPEWYEQGKIVIEQMIEQLQQLISD
ncbi:MAG: hypothetical protein D4S01_03400 [Dehalococcoidia bacterium]|nr:MAG: hypothetical protein D4S01_03400 [Dehalococcoidia bacterium]